MPGKRTPCTVRKACDSNPVVPALRTSRAIATVPRVGAAGRLRSWGGKVRANPWLAVGIVASVLLVCTWIGWAIHVTSEHGARQGLGVLIVWPAIAAVVTLIAIPFAWAFHLIRAGTSSNQTPSESDPDPADEVTETG
jgi:hypothetical protein